MGPANISRRIRAVKDMGDIVRCNACLQIDTIESAIHELSIVEPGNGNGCFPRRQ
jgi:hypothetical protein